MCHGCVYTGSFVLDHHALRLAAIHLHRIEISYRTFPERVGPRILSLESVDYFGTIDYFSGRKKVQCYEHNFEVYWKTRIEDRGSVKKIEMK